jgi:ELWxxDGT repeat protein
LTLLPNEELFFVLDTPESGAELWSLDSNSLEPRLVEDIYRGELPSDIGGVYRYGDMVYLGAKAGCTGFELFSAKRNGVTLELDANTSFPGSLPEDMFAMSNSLYFTAETGATGRELFVSDGTGEQTYLLKDFTPGRTGETKFQAVEHQGVTYFNAVSIFTSNNFRNAGVYKTNGTRSGTQAIVSVEEGSRGEQFSKPFIFKGKIIFFSNLFGSTSLISYDPVTETLDTLAREFHQMHFFYGDIVQLNEDAFMVESLSSNGVLPFISDGTREGTRPLDDLLGHNIVDGFNFKNAIFYGHQEAGGSEELFRTDGTVSGTYSVTEENLPNASFLRSVQPISLNDTLYFTASSSAGRFFYGTDGTAGNYFEIPYPDGIMLYPSRRIETLNDDIYFPGEDENGYKYLYRTNADKSAFERISDIPAGPFLQQPVAMNVFNGYVYFNGFSEDYGEELYRTDGTNAGTERLSDINPGASFARPIFLTIFKDAIYFTANDGALGFELWRYDENGITGMNDPFASASCPALPSNTDDFLLNSNITLFPNPASDKFAVDLPDGIQFGLSIYSASGQMVKTVPIFTAGEEMNVADLPAGSYFVTIKSNRTGKVNIKQFLIQR